MRSTSGQEGEVLTSLSLHLHWLPLHLGSPWGPLNGSLTKPDLALVYEGNEITAPGGTAAGALAQPFQALLFLSFVTCCLLLGVELYNLMNAFSY